jgi:hypothetical protein
MDWSWVIYVCEGSWGVIYIFSKVWVGKVCVIWGVRNVVF